jgi:hypothetical protein
MSSARTCVYLIPGRHEQLAASGHSALERGDAFVQPRLLNRGFLRQPFGAQIALIGEDLKAAHWHVDGRIIARSYGAYLLLHALAELPAFPGHVLLLSPVIGEARSADGYEISRPPRADRLLALADDGRFPAPASLTIYAGAADLECSPTLLRRFAAAVPRCRAHLIEGAAHELPLQCHAKAMAELLRSSTA